MKNQNPFDLAGLVAVVLTGTTLFAQSGARQETLRRTGEPRRDVAQSCALADEGDHLFGFGRDYAARFDARGLEFTPALGAAAPQTQRLRFTLESIVHGKTPFALEPAVAPQREGRYARYPRSADVTERYEVRADGVEQSFVFARLPGSGELVVRGRLATELAASVDGDGVAFLAPGLGGVAFGGVLGIDALGRTAKGSLRVVDGMLELRLPGSFVDGAALPLVLDPLIGTRRDVNNAATDDSAVDVAFDATSYTDLFVWERSFSANEVHVYGRTYARLTGAYGAEFLIAGGANVRCTTAAVANHNPSDRFVVVWAESLGLFGTSKLYLRPISATGTVGASTQVPVTGGSSNYEPDLSGNPAVSVGSGDTGVIVWEELGAGIRALRYTLGATISAVGFGSIVAVTANAHTKRPRISRSSESRLAVVFEERPGSFTGVGVRALTRAGAIEGNGSLRINIGVGPDLVRPDVDGDGNDFMVVWERRSALADGDIWCAMFGWNGVGIVLAGNVDAPVAATAGVDERDPVVVHAGAKYVTAWTKVVGFLDSVIAGRALALTGCQSCGAEFIAPPARSSEQAAALASERSGGVLDGTITMIGYESTGPAPGFSGDICGALFSNFGGGSAVPVASGCGPTVDLVTLSLPSIGNPAFGFRVTHAQPGALFTGLSIGFGGSALSCGTCSILLPDVLTPVAMAGGNGQIPLALPCQASLMGAVFETQALVLGAVVGSCPLVPELATSSRLRITLGE